MEEKHDSFLWSQQTGTNRSRRIETVWSYKRFLYPVSWKTCARERIKISYQGIQGS